MLMQSNYQTTRSHPICHQNRTSRHFSGDPDTFHLGILLAADGGAGDRATTTVMVPSELRPLAVSTIILPTDGCWYEYTTRGLSLGRSTSCALRLASSEMSDSRKNADIFSFVGKRKFWASPLENQLILNKVRPLSL